MYYSLLGPDDNRAISVKYLSQLEQMDWKPQLKLSIIILAEQWRHLTGQIKEVEKEIRKQSREGEQVTRIYESVPGVGLITARELANELGELKIRF